MKKPFCIVIAKEYIILLEGLKSLLPSHPDLSVSKCWASLTKSAGWNIAAILIDWPQNGKKRESENGKGG